MSFHLLMISIKVACLPTIGQTPIVLANYLRPVRLRLFEGIKVPNSKWKNKCLHLVLSYQSAMANINQKHKSGKNYSEKESFSSFYCNFYSFLRKVCSPAFLCRHHWLWVELCPPKKIFWNPNPLVPVNGTLFGNRVFKDVFKLQCGYWP